LNPSFLKKEVVSMLTKEQLAHFRSILTAQLKEFEAEFGKNDHFQTETAPLTILSGNCPVTIIIPPIPVLNCLSGKKILP